MHHDRTKHVEVDRHFKTEKIEEGNVNIPHILTKKQPTYILTKWLQRSYEDLTSKLGIIDIFEAA